MFQALIRSPYAKRDSRLSLHCDDDTVLVASTSIVERACEDVNLSLTLIASTEIIADDLVYVRVQMDGGPQVMPTLVLHSVPYWLATIDTRRMKKDDERRLEILTSQRGAVDASLLAPLMSSWRAAILSCFFQLFITIDK